MDAVKYLKERRRMCKVNTHCYTCPLNNCIEYERKKTEQAVETVEKWSEEHPQKTMLQDFLEKYPNAPKECTGEPHICPCHLGYEEYMDCEENCLDCWNRPLEG